MTSALLTGLLNNSVLMSGLPKYEELLSTMKRKGRHLISLERQLSPCRNKNQVPDLFGGWYT